MVSLNKFIYNFLLFATPVNSNLKVVGWIKEVIYVTCYFKLIGNSLSLASVWKIENSAICRNNNIKLTHILIHL